jgi:hypothetical protein
MELDLNELGMAAAGTTSQSTEHTIALPARLRRIGFAREYLGGSGRLVKSQEYTGLVADVAFGNKGRTWGMFLGPEHLLKERCPGFRYVRLGHNSFFFVGSWG